MKSEMNQSDERAAQLMRLQAEDSRRKYLNELFQYDHPFNEAYDHGDRITRQYVDLQPAVEPTSARLLSFLVRLMKATHVLEVGTSVGYSAHWLAVALKENHGRLITIDNHPRTAKEAQKHFEESGLSDVITFYNEDAVQVVSRLRESVEKGNQEPFDLVFMDCGKALYLPMLDDFDAVLKKGGVIAFDDTLIAWEPEVRAGIAKKVSDFNDHLKKDNRFYVVNLDIGHGLTLCYKK